ncbi:hypothetical protein SCP_0806410 [Sparassis crispa]|uniref:G-alpha-domain-containing protein n=1 Tax=Sparassis crispa TaxID=139825 RepID=A0A401GV52_9APHY|nr:hypothetical protein SCP_0806410 [Sparassis crispa]GBE86117.1 hypothetical protein SCP_0806410 [Sparassis crispa]
MASKLFSAAAEAAGVAGANDDPLARVLAPPADETAEARAARLERAVEAQRVSHEIDEDIQESKKAFERRKKAIKILLLGQAESGKSTTLKNFQLAFSPQHFRSERAAWRTIIQLNLIRSVKRLLEVLDEEWDSELTAPVKSALKSAPSSPTASSSSPRAARSRSGSRSGSPSRTRPPQSIALPPSALANPAAGSSRAHAIAHPHASTSAASSSHHPAPSFLPPSSAPRHASHPSTSTSVRFSTTPLTDTHRRLRGRLRVLLPLEAALARALLPPDDAVTGPAGDVCVRAGSAWKGAASVLASSGLAVNGVNLPNGKGKEHVDDPTRTLAACKDDVVTLWEDPVVRAVLKRRGVRLQDMPGFFLNDTARIATLNYQPTDDDIVRARLRTLGVEEHRFTMESGGLPGSEWYIYDVGGSRSNRPHWIPFFDDVQAIIFLAPLAFNLMLEEDPRVNRVEDSISLWREICGNGLLAKTTLILFLNKMDILQATLAAGIRVAKYVPSYGDQPNDIQHVTKYFRDKFRGYHKRLSPHTRPFYVHETSVVDTRSTAAILVGVREGILRAHLQSVNVI